MGDFSDYYEYWLIKLRLYFNFYFHKLIDKMNSSLHCIY